MAEVIFFDDCFELRESRRGRIQEGHSIRDYLDQQSIIEFQNPTLCLVNESVILRKDWKVLEIQDSDVVVFLRLPAGGGGGGGNKLLRSVMMIVVAVAAFYTGGLAAGLYSGTSALIGGAIQVGVSAVVSIAGGALVNSFLPPPKPKLQSASSSEDRESSPTYSITSSGNKARLGDSIPEIYGRHKVFMDLASMPYTRYENNEQYLFQYHVIGRGEYDIENIFIGDTDLTSFEEAEIEHLEPGQAITLFDPHVVTALEVGSLELPNTNIRGPFTVNQAKSEITKLEFDTFFPKGIYYSNDTGGLDDVSITYKFESRKIDDLGIALGDWVTLDTITKTAATTTPQRLSYSYTVPSGRYEVRFQRTSSKNTSFRYGNDITIQSVKGYLVGKNSYSDMTLLAVKIRATSNLNQNSSRKINAIVKRKLPIWNGTTWDDPAYTNNPAWIIADMIQRVDKGSYDSLDLEDLLSEAESLTNDGVTYNAVFDSPVSTREALNQVAKVARGVVIEVGGKFKIVRDTPTLVPLAMFTPNNIKKGTLTIDYAMPTEDTANTVELSYFDDELWNFREVEYTSPNTTKGQTAKVKMIGITNSDEAEKMAEYLALANVYRRKSMTFETGLEGIIPSYGDLISVTDDFIADSITGEVVGYNGGVLTLSESLPSSDASDWLLMLRNRNGSNSQNFEFTIGPELNQITLTSGSFTPYVDGSEERTLFELNQFKEWGVTAKVIAVRPKGGESVEIVCTPEDLRVYGLSGEDGISAEAASQLVIGLIKPGGDIANDTGFHKENLGISEDVEEDLIIGTIKPAGEVI
ncbi:MAG: phage tail protein [Lentisphaeraceae bacterium]|nr:phage tail protein [Lentisphaeraceae bacterium]